jgi:hypothetical protein
LGSVKSKFASFGDTLENEIIVRKLLHLVPKKFLPIVAIMEQYSNIDTVPFEEAMGKITAFEERIKGVEPEENDLSKLLIASSSNSEKWHNGKGRGDQGRGRGLGSGFGRKREKGTEHGD